MSLAGNDNMGHLPHVRFWKTTRFELSLAHPLVMGIVNVTPDSFSDGGRFFNAGRSSSALAHCERLVTEGATLLDIGGESSRPGAPPLPWPRRRSGA